jgi:amino acid transporter
VAIVGLRWIALAAAAGPSSLTLWVLALLAFFIPQGFAVARLGTAYPGEGGVYVWTSEALGPRHGFLAGWCYWANNVVYYPTLLVALAGFATFVGGEATRPLEESTTYVVVFSLVVLWLALGFNILGLRTGRWVQNLGGLATWIPGVLLIAFGVVALLRFGSATPMPAGSLLPRLTDTETIPFFANICFALAGLELAPVLGGEIRDPRRILPRAILVSGVAIVGVYLLGTWALLVALPVQEVSVITGVLQAIDAVGRRIGVGVVGPWVAVLMVLGGLGGVGAWLGGSARILFVAGMERHLPRHLAAVHPRWGSPHVALVVQGLLASVFVLVGSLGSAPQELYHLLVDMTLLVYFIPYLYIFLSLILLDPRIRRSSSAGVAGIPGGRLGTWAFGLLGMLTVLLAMGLSFIPPAEAPDKWAYVAKVVGGTAFFVGSGWALYERSRRSAGAGESRG